MNDKSGKSMEPMEDKALDVNAGVPRTGVGALDDIGVTSGVSGSRVVST